MGDSKDGEVDMLDSNFCRVRAENTLVIAKGGVSCYVKEEEATVRTCSYKVCAVGQPT